MTPESEPKLAVSKRLRAEIFRRDNHTCQSCGAKAPDVAIVPDHVVPVALGGSDHPSNLQTLCEPCNSGKSATPPDAAVVAKVAEDALRWSQAIQAAADDMLGGVKGRDTARATFDAKWKSWSEGRPAVPRPADWGVSVDNFLKAGLPMPILLDCVDIAMRARTVKADEVFTYMCGAAWKEVKKLHVAAKVSLAPKGEPAPSEEDAYLDPEDEEYEADFDPRMEPGRESFAQEILTWSDMPEIDHFLKVAREEYAETYEDDPTESVITMRAAKESMSQAYWNIRHLTRAVNSLLDLLPHQEVTKALTEALANLPDPVKEQPPTLREARQLKDAVDLIALRRAEAYLDAMTPEERVEWIAYAITWHGPASPWDASAEISEQKKTLHAARLARGAKEGLIWTVMCIGNGKHIERCPNRAVYDVAFAELTCCDSWSSPEHQLHGLCGSHMESAVDRGIGDPAGDIITVRDFKELPERD